MAKDPTPIPPLSNRGVDFGSPEKRSSPGSPLPDRWVDNPIKERRATPIPPLWDGGVDFGDDKDSKK
jgi:hypothetical protein